jgi:pimeloyl-ACP methyl ester carboxylesterase
MGGRIAINFVHKYPEMVRSLTLFDSALDGYANTVDWNVHAKEKGIEYAKAAWLNHDIFTATRDNPHAMKAIGEIINDYSGWHWLQDDPQLHTNARVELAAINIPTLVAVGEKDLPYFQDIAKVIADELPSSEMITISKVGHMTPMEAPDYCNRLLLTHIERYSLRRK